VCDKQNLATAEKFSKFILVVAFVYFSIELWVPFFMEIVL